MSRFPSNTCQIQTCRREMNRRNLQNELSMGEKRAPGGGVPGVIGRNRPYTFRWANNTDTSRDSKMYYCQCYWRRVHHRGDRRPLPCRPFAVQFLVQRYAFTVILVGVIKQFIKQVLIKSTRYEYIIQWLFSNPNIRQGLFNISYCN